MNYLFDPESVSVSCMLANGRIPSNAPAI